MKVGHGNTARRLWLSTGMSLIGIVMSTTGLGAERAGQTEYTSFQGDSYTMDIWQGRNVSFLTPVGIPAYIQNATMLAIVDAVDDAYDYYLLATGHKPTPYTATTRNGRATIAVVDKTCGAGCRELGTDPSFLGAAPDGHHLIAASLEFVGDHPDGHGVTPCGQTCADGLDVTRLPGPEFQQGENAGLACDAAEFLDGFDVEILGQLLAVQEEQRSITRTVPNGDTFIILNQARIRYLLPSISRYTVIKLTRVHGHLKVVLQVVFLRSRTLARTEYKDIGSLRAFLKDYAVCVSLSCQCFVRHNRTHSCPLK